VLPCIPCIPFVPSCLSPSARDGFSLGVFRPCKPTPNWTKLQHMKRWIRKTLTIGLGLTLGWWAAGCLPNASHANEAAHEAGEPHPTTAVTNHETPAGETHEADAGQIAAAQLVPQTSDTLWLKPVLGIAGGLFLAALVIGLPLAKLKRPASATHDAHAAHDATTGGHSAGGHAH